MSLFTIGLLLWADVRPSLEFWFIPIVWGFIGIGPVLFYGVYADLGTILSAIIGLYYYLKWPPE